MQLYWVRQVCKKKKNKGKRKKEKVRNKIQENKFKMKCFIPLFPYSLKGDMYERKKI